MTNEMTNDTDPTQLLSEIDALFDLLAEVDDHEQLTRLESLAASFSPNAIASVRKLLQGVNRHANFFAQPAAASVLHDRPFNPGDSIGRWRVDGELGRGGQAVALAVTRQEGGFDQRAVLKMPLGEPPSPDAIRRLLRERQLLATLKHPGLPALIDGGVRENGTPFLVIERIDGVPIDRHVDERQSSLSERIALLRQVAQIVAYAHAQLILHRDIKPANILIEADGRVVLLDFGVAQSLKPQDTATSAGYTLAYAAPEQVRGERCSAATDVYGLAALGCRLLTGESPFPGLTATAQLRAVLEATPTLPTHLDRDLIAILQRALRKEPSSRYASVAEFDAELQRWQANLPVLAHEGGRRYFFGKWLRRWRVAVAVSLMLSVITGVALWQAQRANQFAAQAESERGTAVRELTRQELLQEHYASVFNRLLQSGTDIAPEALIEALGDIRIAAVSEDQRATQSVVLAVADLQLTRGDYAAAIKTLEPLADSLPELTALEQVGLAETSATALLRTGKLDDADAALERGEAVLAEVPESRLPLAKASLAVVRAQILRARGKLPEALAMAHIAADLVQNSTITSPVRVGQMLSNCALTAMYAGDISLARTWGQLGLDILKSAGLADMGSYQTSEANLATMDIVAGDPAKALVRFEAIEQNAPDNENATAREARRLLMARALVLMGQGDRALKMVEASSKAFCALLGDDTPDCERARIAGADIANWLGDVPRASAFMNAVRQPDAPAIAANFNATRAMQQLNAAPSAATVSAVDSMLAAQAAAPGLGRRSAFRQRLAASERLFTAGHEALARQLIASLAADPALIKDVDGIDRIWMQLWRADHAGTLGDQQPLVDDLERLLGQDHASVLAWRARVVAAGTT